MRSNLRTPRPDDIAPPDEVVLACSHAVAALREARWSSMRGGQSNRSWTAGTPGAECVVKLYGGRPSDDGAERVEAGDARQGSRGDVPDAGPANPMFANDPVAEAMALDHLAPMGLAPERIASLDTSHGRCLIYRRIPGLPWRRGTERVAGLLGRIHAIAPPPGLRRQDGSGAAVLAHGAAILALCPAGEASDRLAAARPPDPGVANVAAPALVHGDPVPGNIIEGPSGLTAIDWQCPAAGDPCGDFAIFLSPSMQLAYRGRALTSAERAAFLNAADPTLVTRYRALAPALHWRLAAYRLWCGPARGTDVAREVEMELAAGVIP